MRKKNPAKSFASQSSLTNISKPAEEKSFHPFSPSHPPHIAIEICVSCGFGMATDALQSWREAKWSSSHKMWIAITWQCERICGLDYIIELLNTLWINDLGVFCCVRKASFSNILSQTSWLVLIKLYLSQMTFAWLTQF